MMNIAINNDVYNWANSYAQEHHTNIKDIVESYLLKLRHTTAKVDDAESQLRQLISLTKGMKLDSDDLNGDKAKGSYLLDKYAK